MELNQNNKILLDLGCGPHKRADDKWIGIDKINFNNVDICDDVLSYITRLSDNSVHGINAAHFVEHLQQHERVILFNECYRILKPGYIMHVECPHSACPSAYGDPTHVWPPVNEWTFFYLNKRWRDACAPHCGYTCNFEAQFHTVANKTIVIHADLIKI